MTGIGNTLYMEEQAGIDSFATQMQAEECESVNRLRVSARKLRTGPCLIRGELNASVKYDWEGSICARAEICSTAKERDIFYNLCASCRDQFIHCEYAYKVEIN